MHTVERFTITRVAVSSAPGVQHTLYARCGDCAWWLVTADPGRFIAACYDHEDDLESAPPMEEAEAVLNGALDGLDRDAVLPSGRARYLLSHLAAVGWRLAPMEEQ